MGKKRFSLAYKKPFISTIIIVLMFLLTIASIFYVNRAEGFEDPASYTVFGYISYSYNNAPTPNGIDVLFTNTRNHNTYTLQTMTSGTNITGFYYLQDTHILSGTQTGDTINISVTYAGNTGYQTFIDGSSSAQYERVNVPIDGNHPPNMPNKPSGLETVYRGQSYSFSINTTDDEGDQIQYMFDWGDGTYSDWTALVASGASVASSYTWNSLETYQIRAKAKDEHGAEIGWSQPGNITGWSQPFNITVVNTLPTASFVYNYTVTNSHTIYFTDESTDSDGSIASWGWNLGDGNISTDQNPIHQYQLKGTYNVILNVTDNDGATNVTNNTITVVNSIPIASFTYLPVNPTDLDTIQFSDVSTDSDGSIVNWSWDFGDGNASNLQNPMHQYADNGTYNVTLNIIDDEGSTSSKQQEITVANVPPTADFTYDRSTVPFPTQFTDQSTDPDGTITAWLWNFGDTYNSTKQNPIHIYYNLGTYTVNLTTTDNDGATNITTKTITITQQSYHALSNLYPIANFTYTPTNPTISTTIQFTDQSTDPDGTITSWLWDFRDGTISTNASPAYIYVNEGTYDVILVVTDNQGATNMTAVTITVAETTDLYLNALNIVFSNKNPSINETIAINATIHNSGNSTATATIKIYDGNPSLNTSKLIGTYNTSIPPNKTSTVTTQWNTTAIGTHNIYVVISDSHPSETNEENNIAFNTLIVKEETTQTTSINLTLAVFITMTIFIILAISAMAFSHLKKKKKHQKSKK